MKTCVNCRRPFPEVALINPAENLGDLLQESNIVIDDQDLCQACKEEFGMRTLMGFGE